MKYLINLMNTNKPALIILAVSVACFVQGFVLILFLIITK